MFCLGRLFWVFFGVLFRDFFFSIVLEYLSNSCSFGADFGAVGWYVVFFRLFFICKIGLTLGLAF